MSNKPYMNYLAIKREFEASFSQCVAKLGVAPKDKRQFWLDKLAEIDSKYSEFKTLPIPDHEPY